MSLPSKKTKIICTIGPASSTQPVLEQMIQNGMDIARVNLTHGNLDKHAEALANVRAAAAAVCRPVAIWGDLPGPKLRIGRLAGDTIRLERGQRFILQAGEFVGDVSRAAVGFTALPKAVRAGDRIFLRDGFIELEVEAGCGEEIHCRVLVGGELRTHDGMNVPGVDLGRLAFTDRDRARLAFAAEQRLDAISPSFIQNAADLSAVRTASAALDYRPFLLAKIERALAVQDLDAILDSADGIVVARGDLGVETPIEEIALLQKRLIHQANLRAKPVVTATHMLESMVHHQLPTRAEVADVTNAILDGTDCLTLSAETALGNHPVQTVAMMGRIAQATEAQASRDQIAPGARDRRAAILENQEGSVSRAIWDAVEQLEPAAIVTHTLSGAAARQISALRLPAWIVAFSPNVDTCQALQFSYGVYPVHQPPTPNWEELASNWLLRHGVTGKAVLPMRRSPDEGSTKPLFVRVIDLDTQPRSAFTRHQ
jgi:pyruvate kinase